MLKLAVLGIAVMCLWNVAAHAAAPRGAQVAAIMFRWLPAAIAAGAATALALGGTAFLLSLASAP